MNNLEMSNQDAFLQLCGDCEGVDLMGITEEDVRNLAKNYDDMTEDDLESAIKGLLEMQQEAVEAA